MINFCVEEMKKGEERFRLEEYNIYKKSLPLGVWNTGSAFPPNHYIEYTLTALHLKKYDEVAVFHKEYQSKLQSKFIPDIPSLCTPCTTSVY